MKKKNQQQWILVRTKISFLIIFFLLMRTVALAQDIIEISGLVTDQEKHEPLPGVAISIKGTLAGTVTSSEGVFTLRTKQKLPFTLVFTSVGFTPQQVEVTSVGSKLQVALSTQTVLGNEVVVTASRVAENIPF